jgi:hypothetical protein
MVDSIGDSSGDSGKEFVFFESCEGSSKFQYNTDITADGHIENALEVAVQLQDEAFNTSLFDSSIKYLILKWHSIYALILRRGTLRITEGQYDDARVMLDWTSKYGNLPSPSTMRRNIIPETRDFYYARSVV